jgi:hypothetical protein
VELSPGEKARKKFQSRFTRSSIYKGGRERSQEEKKSGAALAQNIFDRAD